MPRRIVLDVSLLPGVESPAFSTGKVNYPEDFSAFTVSEHKDIGLWNSATFRDGARKDASVVSLSCLVLDYDGKHGTPLGSVDEALDSIYAMWSWDHVVHSSWSHTPEKPRLRVVLPLSRPVSPAEYAALYTAALARDPRIDPSCRNPSRFFYGPAKKTLDAEGVYEYNSGELLDPATLAGPHSAHNGASGSSSPPSSRSEGVSSHAGVVTSGGPGSDGYRAPLVRLLPSRAVIGPDVVGPAPQTTPRGALGGSTEENPNPFAGAQKKEDFARVRAGCAFVQHAVADAETLPNPEWRALLSILTKCEDGEALAHTVSQPYPGYSPEECGHEYERVAAYGPMTCATIEQQAGTAWCGTCPHRGKITSPIQLGAPPAEPPRPAVLRLAVLQQAPPAVEPAAAEEMILQAEARAEAARQAEGEAIGARDAARRRYALASRLGAAQDETDAALKDKLATDAKAREATAARRRAELALERLRTAAAVVGLPPGANPEVWGRLTLIAPAGAVKPADTVGNVLRIFNEDPAWSERLTFDAFANRLCLDGTALPEGKATDLTAELSYRYALDTTSARVKECMYASSRRREFHPVRQYLDALSWDGTARVDTALFDGFGVDPDDAYQDVLRLVSRRFLVSMVARVYEPGCQVDTMPILYGGQGDGKSQAFAALASRPWFGRTDMDLGDKDSYMQIQGTWLYEMAELHALRRAEAAKAKQWISSDTDRYRAPYASAVEDHPRQTVIVGTHNPELGGEFLTDPTGNRRYWPAGCVRVIDVDWIVDHRDALFAEAVVLYKREAHLGRKRSADTRWWFAKGQPDFDRLEEMTERHVVVDPWRYPIYQFLVAEARRPSKVVYSFTAEDILARVFMRTNGEATHGERTRIGRILSRIGLTSTSRTLAGCSHMYYYLDQDSKTKLGIPSLLDSSAASSGANPHANPFSHESRG